MSEQSFKILFQTDLETNVKELEYWSNKFRGKIPKSIKNRIEKLKYVSSMQYKAEQEKEKQKEQLMSPDEVGKKRESDVFENNLPPYLKKRREAIKENKDAKLVL